jgi:hypothetical protein
MERIKMTKTDTDYQIIDNRILPHSHFTVGEMHCRCGCGMRVTPKLIVLLEALRSLVGRPLIINSGARCTVHNKSVGGYPKSKHLSGIAADIRVIDESHSYSIIHHAPNLGFNGIGVDDAFIHVDLRAKPARWTY